MPPASHPLPPTPKSKPSTSGLLAAFKNLTGTRPKQLTDNTTASQTLGSPFSSYTSPTLDASESGSYLGTISEGLRGSSGKLLAQDVSLESIGGPPKLLPLLRQLKATNHIDSRLVAAKSLVPILYNYPVENVSAIWQLAKDLTDFVEPETASQIAYELLLACVNHRTLSASDRELFFNSVASGRKQDTFEIRFRILSEITNHGRNLECLEVIIAPLATRLLEQCFHAAKSARSAARIARKERIARVDGPQITEDNFNSIFHFVADCIKFNAKILRENDLTIIIEQILCICRKTTMESDLMKSLEVIDAMIAYSHLPIMTLPDCLQTLCTVYCQIEKLKDQSWNVLRHVLTSHNGLEATRTLLDILKDQPGKFHAIRGAVMAFHTMYLSDDERFIKPSISDLFEALKASLALESMKLVTEISRLLLSVLSDLDLIQTVLVGDHLNEFIEVLVICCRKSADATRQEIDKTEMENDVKEQLGHVVALQKVIDCLVNISIDMEYEQKRSVMNMLLRVSSNLDDRAADATIRYYVDERLLLPSNDAWKEHCKDIARAFFEDTFRSLQVRIIALEAILDAYNTAEALNYNVEDFVVQFLSWIKSENDLAVITKLTSLAVDIATWTSSHETFKNVLLLLNQAIISKTSYRHALIDDFKSQRSASQMVQICTAIARGVVTTFLRSISRSQWKASQLYETILQMTGDEMCHTSARLVFLKLLFRLRADAKYAVFVVEFVDCGSLALVLGRSAEQSSGVAASVESPPQRALQPDEISQQLKRSPQTLPQLSQSNKMTSTVKNSAPQQIAITTLSLPLWSHPDPHPLPEIPQSSASHLVFTKFEDDVDHDRIDHGSSETSRVVLKSSMWLELILLLLQQNNLDWNLYSYIISHLSSQLSNHSFFADSVPQIKLLRSVICQQLSNKSYHEPSSASTKKSDVAVCLYDVLTMLVSYTEYFSKNEEDDIVKLFVVGIGGWEKTSECCIHGLAICCHEIPLSLSKSLENILQKLSQIITQAHVAVHVLEFMAGLARLPDLFRNFREEEFRMVFGICFRYLQSARDQRSKALAVIGGHKSALALARHSISVQHASREVLLASERTTNSRPMTEDLPQYVYSLAYHVMTFWFMSLKLQDRPRQIPWIIKNLVYSNNEGRDVMEEQATVTVDMMHRISHSDQDDTTPDTTFAKLSDGKITSKTWLSGMSILTIDTASRTGISQITRRRPSGTKYSILRPHITRHPRHQVPICTGLAAETYYTDSFVGVLPDDIVQEFYSPMTFSSAISAAECPIPLPDDSATSRSIAAFDRIPALDGHKVGIIYIGEAQTSESEILANVMGSADYTEFLEGIGILTELRNAKFNTQGLDREFDTDGKFTFCWRDRVTELVFHVTTMMPTNLEHDPLCTAKKRHTGNDFVNIIFNNSGNQFDFDTFPSDFNYVNIVITPEARTSFVETRLRAGKNSNSRLPAESSKEEDETKTVADVSQDYFYKVTVMTKPGIPKISAASDTKIISGRNLPAFVRLLALNASVFSHVWANRDGGEHVSSWRNRLREIVKLRDKHADTIGSMLPMPPPVTGGISSPSPLALSPIAAPPTGRSNNAVAYEAKEGSVFRRTSVATFFSADSNRSSAFSGATEMERTSSTGSII